jgi:hypothetical protein
MHFNITLPFMSRPSKQTNFPGLPIKALYQFLFDTMRATCSAHVCLGSSSSSSKNNNHYHSWGPISCSGMVFVLVNWLNRLSVNQPIKRNLRSFAWDIRNWNYVFEDLGIGPCERLRFRIHLRSYKFVLRTKHREKEYIHPYIHTYIPEVAPEPVIHVIDRLKTVRTVDQGCPTPPSHTAERATPFNVGCFAG